MTTVIRNAMRRIGPWLTPALVAVEIVLVWTGVISLVSAVIVVVVVEALLAVTALSRAAVAVRLYRADRARGDGRWAAAENGMAAMLPRPLARALLIEAQMWVCLVRWALRPRLDVNSFTYGKNLRPLMRIVVALLVVEGIVVEAVLVLVLGHTSPWVWIALALHVYGLVWIGGFLGSLRVLPHQFHDGSLVLRDSVFTTVVIPLERIKSVRPRRRGYAGRSGFTIEDGAALLTYGDANVRLVLHSYEGVLLRSAPLPQALNTLDLSVDDPDRFVATIADRIQQPAPPA